MFLVVDYFSRLYEIEITKFFTGEKIIYALEGIFLVEMDFLKQSHQIMRLSLDL